MCKEDLNKRVCLRKDALNWDAVTKAKSHKVLVLHCICYIQRIVYFKYIENSNILFVVDV